MGNTIIQARPFLKWAGGKGQLISQMQAYLPAQVSRSGIIKRYFEPFLGGGAFFFWLSAEFSVEDAVLIERNVEVAKTFIDVRDNVKRLIKELEGFEKEYFSLSEEGREEFFYAMREELNARRLDKNNGNGAHRSALLIFLNRTCFNGLYRVNSRGEFNVPFGRYKNPTICDEDNLLAASEALKVAKIVAGDFAQCLKNAQEGDFVYFDPPYRPISTTSNFNSYSKDCFDDMEQKRLREVFGKLDDEGVFVMLSNSDPKNNNPLDGFFDELYEGYRIERIKANRMINCCAEKRGEISEILVMNY